MSKTMASAPAGAPVAAPVSGPVSAPAAAPAAPVWVVLAAWLEVRKPDGLALDIGPGRLVRVGAAKAGEMVAAGSARAASESDISMGESLGRDLTIGGYSYA